MEELFPHRGTTNVGTVVVKELSDFFSVCLEAPPPSLANFVEKRRKLNNGGIYVSAYMPEFLK